MQPTSSRQNPAFLTAAEFAIVNFNKWKKITYGCSNLDELTKGGIQTSGITEISGESGSGKTQICLQVSVTVQLLEKHGGLSKGAVFFCTEHQFPAQRCQDIINYVIVKHPQYKTHNFLDNIFIQQTYKWEKLQLAITQCLPDLLARNRIGIIIIDSIAGIFRSTDLDTCDRAYKMRSIIHSLINISNKYECAVLCSNQVATFDHEGISVTVPTLGLAWANLVTSRIVLSKAANNNVDDNGSSSVRKFEVQFSPYLPNNFCFYQITGDGIANAAES